MACGGNPHAMQVFHHLLTFFGGSCILQTGHAWHATRMPCMASLQPLLEVKAQQNFGCRLNPAALVENSNKDQLNKSFIFQYGGKM